MMNAGEEIFWENATHLLRDIGMPHLDPAHGAAVDIVRWCLKFHGRPTHHRQAFLEEQSPVLLAYLEKLASSGDTAAWRTLEERIRLRAELLRETNSYPCRRPWLAAIWHVLPEIAALGQIILDRPTKDADRAPDALPVASDPATGAATGGESDKGSAGKAGSAGTMAKPRSLPRLVIPVVAVKPTVAEEKALGLVEKKEELETKNAVTTDATEKSGPLAPKTPGGPK